MKDLKEKLDFKKMFAEVELSAKETSLVVGGSTEPCFGSHSTIGDWSSGGCTYEDWLWCDTGSIDCDVSVDG